MRRRDFDAVFHSRERDSGGAGDGSPLNLRAKDALPADFAADLGLLRVDANLIGLFRRSERRRPRYSQVLSVFPGAADLVQHAANAAGRTRFSSGRDWNDYAIGL